MALRDTWRRALEYFGLVEGDYIEEGEYAEEPTGSHAVYVDEPPPVREPAPMRAGRGARARARTARLDEIDEIFGEERPPRRGRAGELRAVEPVGNGGDLHQIHMVTPRSFNDAQQVADEFKRSKPVIINLQTADRELAKRLIDFASGLTYALGGGMQRIAERTFLLTPRNVEVSAEEKAAILERGFFNQS